MSLGVRLAAAALLVGWWTSTPAAHADPAEIPAPPGPPSDIAGTGTFAVGSQIEPGTYRSAGPVEDGACYWKRVSGDTLVDNAMSKQPQIVQIQASDTSFKTSDCQPWQRIDDCLPGCGPAAPNPLDLLGQIGSILAQNPGPPPA